MKFYVIKKRKGHLSFRGAGASLFSHPKSVLAFLFLLTVLCRSIPDQVCNTNTDCEKISPFSFCDQAGYNIEGKCACIGGRTYNPNQRKCQCTPDTNAAAESNTLLGGNHGGCISVSKKWQAIPCVSGTITKFKVSGTDSTGAYCKCDEYFYGQSCEFDSRNDESLKKLKSLEIENKNLTTQMEAQQQKIETSGSSTGFYILSVVLGIVLGSVVTYFAQKHYYWKRALLLENREQNQNRSLPNEPVEMGLLKK